MEHFVASCAGLVAFLDNPLLKMAGVFVGTFLLRRWPKFVNEAVPAWTGIASVATAVLHWASIQAVPDAQPHALLGIGTFLLAAAHVAAPWWQSLLGAVLQNGILPWLLGFGGQRATSQTMTWAQGNAAVQDKPAQTIVQHP